MDVGPDWVWGHWGKFSQNIGVWVDPVGFGHHFFAKLGGSGRKVLVVPFPKLLCGVVQGGHNSHAGSFRQFDVVLSQTR